MKKKILMSVFTLMLGVIFTLTINNVQAAKTYDYEAMSITIPSKFDKWEATVNDESSSYVYISITSEGYGGIYVDYSKVSCDYVRLRTYTTDDVKEAVTDISWDYEEEDFKEESEVLKSELVYIDGVPAVKIRYKVTSVDKKENTTNCWYYESYYVNTDKYSYTFDISLLSGKESYLDSTEFKNMINSIDIKGTVTKNLPEYEVFDHEYMSITVPDDFINRSTNVFEYEDKSYLSASMYENNAEFYYNYWFYGDGDSIEYTSTDVDEMAKEIDSRDAEYESSICRYDIISKNLIYIDGVAAIKIRYREKYYYKDTKESYYYYHEVYYIRTDNVEYEIIQTSYNEESNLDSTLVKNMINSIKIKDTVKATRGIPFKDVKTTAWYYNAVKYCYTNNMIKGINSYIFAPNTKVTRGMLVTILYGMEGAPKVTATNKFSDVISGKYYYNAVVWASSKGIVNGYAGQAKFGPDDYVTRQDLAVILSAYCNYKGKYVKSNYGLSNYSDASNISSYALPAMRWAVNNKIINGSNGALNPKGTATRAEAVTMIYSYCTNIK